MNKLSRQRAYQRRHKQAKLCTLCGAPAVPGKTLCAPHGEAKKKKMRDRYRLAKGIPLDAPLGTKSTMPPLQTAAAMLPTLHL